MQLAKDRTILFVSVTAYVSGAGIVMGAAECPEYKVTVMDVNLNPIPDVETRLNSQSANRNLKNTLYVSADATSSS